MKTILWLIKREYWEHKDGFLWAPAAVSALLIGIMLLWSIGKLFFGMNGVLYVNDVEVVFSNVLSEMQRNAIHESISFATICLYFLLYGLLSFVTFFYCLGALFDERQDKSILFWKSLPISDAATVVSKAIMALVIAPLITLAITIVTIVVLIALVWITAFHGGAMFAGHADMYKELLLAPLQMALLLPLHILWAAPTLAWLFFLSSAVKTKPFLFAIGIPLIGGTVLAFVNEGFHLGLQMEILFRVFSRAYTGLFPGSWVFNPGFDTKPHINDGFFTFIAGSWRMAWENGLWQGAIFATAMLSVTIRLRRNAGEM